MLINSVNLIIWIENKIWEKKQQQFNTKDECFSILEIYMYNIHKTSNDFICILFIKHLISNFFNWKEKSLGDTYVFKEVREIEWYD